MAHSAEKAYLMESVRKYFNHPDQIAHYSAEIDKGLTSAEEYLLNMLPDSGKMLDVGCGAGRVSISLATKGYRITGIDVSEQLLSVARQMAQDRNLDIEFMLTEGITLPFQDELFDIIIGFKVLCYIPTKSWRNAYLKELYRVLKPGGVCLITQNIVPDEFLGEARDQYYYQSPASRFSIIEEGDTFPEGFGYVRWFTEDQLLEELQDTDFELQLFESDQAHNGHGFMRLIKLGKSD